MSISNSSSVPQDITIGKIYKLKPGTAHITFYDHSIPADFVGIMTGHTYVDINDETRHWVVGSKMGFWIPESKLVLDGDQ